MNAEIITIGDEILIGQIVDTNSTYISKALNTIGVSVYQITSIQDNREHILDALGDAEKHADIVIITGGLVFHHVDKSPVILPSLPLPPPQLYNQMPTNNQLLICCQKFQKEATLFSLGHQAIKPSF